MMSVPFVCLFVALILFLLAALNVSSPRFNLVALGLFFWVLSIIYPLFRDFHK